MFAELKKNVINMKHLSQDIEDPIVVNAADANGRTLEIIFTQEAAAQLTPDTKVYLSWYHQQQKIKGYNVFTYTPGTNPKRDPYRWTIFFPQSMLYCGDVLACIEIVDDISIAASNNFMIHVLEDPNDGTPFVVTDDFSEFKTAVIALATLKDQVENDWATMQEEHQYIIQTIEDAVLRLENAEDLLTQIQDIVDDLSSRTGDLEEIVTGLTERIEEVKQEVINESVITVTKNTGSPTSDLLYRYTFKQGGQTIENGVIDIYKDKVVTGGLLVYPTQQNPITIDGISVNSGVYIRFKTSRNTYFYVDVTDLSGINNIIDTTEIIVTDNNGNTSLNIGKISASKITYREADITVTPTIAEQNVREAIDDLNTKVSTLLIWETLTPTG